MDLVDIPEDREAPVDTEAPAAPALAAPGRLWVEECTILPWAIGPHPLGRLWAAACGITRPAPAAAAGACFP